MAVKNVVFDLGRVLVEFEPLAYIRTFGFSEEVTQKLYSVVFGNDWYLHDRGDYETVEDLRCALAARYPEYAARISAVLTGDWVKIHYLKTDTAAYLKELKDRGYNIYILSNLSLESYEFIKQYGFFRYVTGGVFSYQERACKPEPKIYRTLLQRYGLEPAQTVFLDDNPQNVEAARAFGIRAILFTDIAEAKALVEKELND